MTYLATSPSIWGLGIQPYLYVGPGRVVTIQDKRTPRVTTPVSFEVEAKEAQGQPPTLS